MTTMARGVRHFAVGLLMLIGAAGPTASAATPTATDDTFRLLAGELVVELDRVAARRGDRALTIAVWPQPIGRVPVPDSLAREYNDRLLAALLVAGGQRHRFVARDDLRAVVRDRAEASDLDETLDDVLAVLARRAQADVLVVSRLRSLGGDKVQLSYRAVDVTDGTVLAATSHRRLAVAPAEVTAVAQALTLEQALAEATESLVRRAPGLRTLTVNGVRFADSGRETAFGSYLAGRLADALVSAYENQLTGRTIRLRHDQPTSAGGYALSGRYWDFGAVIELRLSLHNAEGVAAVWRDRIRVSSLPRSLSRTPQGRAAPVAKAAPESHQLPRGPAVRQLQQDLYRLGYRFGPIDGLLGPRTRAAIRRYQQRNDLAVTGRLTPALSRHVSQSLARKVARAQSQSQEQVSRTATRRVQVPPGYEPPPGACRLWYPNRSAAYQPPPTSCDSLRGKVPAGAVIVEGHGTWDDYRRRRQAYAAPSGGAYARQAPVAPAPRPVSTPAPQRNSTVAYGQTCRPYVKSVTIGGRRQQTFGTVCRQPDGSWRFASR